MLLSWALFCLDLVEASAFELIAPIPDPQINAVSRKTGFSTDGTQNQEDDSDVVTYKRNSDHMKLMLISQTP